MPWKQGKEPVEPAEKQQLGALEKLNLKVH